MHITVVCTRGEQAAPSCSGAEGSEQPAEDTPVSHAAHRLERALARATDAPHCPCHLKQLGTPACPPGWTKVLGWGQVYPVRATLPPAQHVFGRLHRQHVTP